MKNKPFKKTVFQGRGQTKKVVYVAMSGGVDSSVAATLLKKKGYQVTGVFMRPWSPQLETGNWKLETSCLWKQDREDAMRAAAVLGIPFKTWDFSKEYKREVADYMIREYRAGRTPNPDVMCNKEIKFGLFLKKAIKEGADFIATGHYVRLEKEVSSFQFSVSGNKNSNKKLKTINYKLKTATDKNKDQSYFLWTLTQEQLKYCLFPIGDYVKPDIRKLAKKFGLPNHDKKDSQGVCFIGQLDMKDFLKKYIKPKKGRILDLHGNIIGNHDGVYYYTIGQRHGLDIKNGQGPYFVIKKDIKKNIIYVGDQKDLASRRTRAVEINYLSDKLRLPIKVDVKIRYRSKSKKAILYKNGVLMFNKPIRAITSGQSAVFYRGKEMLGGGVIK